MSQSSLINFRPSPVTHRKNYSNMEEIGIQQTRALFAPLCGFSPESVAYSVSPFSIISLIVSLYNVTVRSLVTSVNS